MDPKRRMDLIARGKKQDNTETIYKRSIKPHAPEITEDRLTYGFETHTEPKLIKLLSDESEEKRISSLTLLYNHISNHLKIIRVLQNDGLKPLLHLLHDPNDTIRQRSAAILSRISVVRAGVEGILAEDGGFETILESIAETNLDICVTVHSIVNHICSTSFVANAVERGCIPVLVESLRIADQDAKFLALDTLYYCNERLAQSISISLSEGLVDAIADILKSQDDNEIEVIQRASSVLSVLCGHVDGKTAAIESGCVEALIDLLNATDDRHTQRIVMESLMTITTNLEGQRVALAHGLGQIIGQFLDSNHQNLILVTIKTISNLAINPDGRKEMQSTITSLELLAKFPDRLIQDSAQEALVRVQWVP
ncbi:hypothetical protein BLNAU_16158 [Blattamonas nauphoetae]|uniref:Uncharacterized protein n=1 Tax=Blattamonas nauphoetae TaxID=2049346 RepID=A0ABQ9XFG3_9EUKA|nr:hypothetical protein BLNAU_16158 [Blattamonas nauphoetae]